MVPDEFFKRLVTHFFFLNANFGVKKRGGSEIIKSWKRKDSNQRDYLRFEGGRFSPKEGTVNFPKELEKKGLKPMGLFEV